MKKQILTFLAGAGLILSLMGWVGSANAAPITPTNSGGAGSNSGTNTAGGGGGGYYGGGGGSDSGSSNYGGGGGGSSFISSVLTATSSAAGANSGNGVMSLAYTLFNTPTIVGNNNAGIVTVATSTTTSTVTFANNAWVNALGVSCYVSAAQSGQTQPPLVVTNTSTMAVTFNVALTIGQKFNYLCLGY